MGVWGISPSEFWGMTPRDFWLIYDGKMRIEYEKSGRMRPSEYRELKESLRDKGIEV